jgi:molybdopterin synthase sulfur carrier subunit
MIITIKYFGLLSEITQVEEETLETSAHDVSGLIEYLVSKYPDLKNKDFKVAQHQELVSNNTLITGQELALLPPFSGG